MQTKIFDGMHPDEEANKWIQANINPICDIKNFQNVGNDGKVHPATVTYNVGNPKEIKSS